MTDQFDTVQFATGPYHLMAGLYTACGIDSTRRSDGSYDSGWVGAYPEVFPVDSRMGKYGGCPKCAKAVIR